MTRGINNLGARQRALTTPVAGLASRAIALGGAYLGADAAVRGTVGNAMALNSQFGELAVKTGMSDAAIAQLRQRLTALSGPANQTVTDLLSGVDTMVGLGLSAEQAAGSIPAIGKAATATGSSMADLGALSTAAIQNLGVAPAEIARLLDNLTAAGNRGAVELRDQASMMPALMAAYQGLGQTGVGAATDLAAALQVVRQGTGDAASAGTNLGNLLQKLNAPQTRKAFSKFGVNLEREMKKATAKGMSPVEAIAEITSKSLKGDLGKLGDLFQDSQVQAALRPLIQQVAEYKRIRDEAMNGGGTVDRAFARRMQDAEQRMKAFRIQMNNLGAAVGANLLEPIGRAADHFANILGTLDRRATVFDRIKAAFGGLGAGLGAEAGGFTEGLKSVERFIFGVADGGAAADELGRIFESFRQFGQTVSNVTGPLKDAGVSLGSIAGIGAGLMVTAAAVRLLGVALGGILRLGGVLRIGALAWGLSALAGSGTEMGAVDWAALGIGVVGFAGGIRTLGGALSGVAKFVGTLGAIARFAAIIAGTSAGLAAAAAAIVALGFAELPGMPNQSTDQGQVDAHLASRQRTGSHVGGAPLENGLMRVGAGQAPGIQQPIGPQSSVSPLDQLRNTVLQARLASGSEVRMTNPPPRPNVNVTVNQTVNMNEAPAAAAAAIADATGRAAQQAVEGGYHDGGV
jgi:TP901 family phage tail tape measure protein